MFPKLCFSGNSYEYFEDLVSLEHNQGSDSPGEIERLKILREGKAEELEVEKSNRGEGMRAIFKRTINSNIDNPSSYFQSIVCQVLISFYQELHAGGARIFPFYG